MSHTTKLFILYLISTCGAILATVLGLITRGEYATWVLGTALFLIIAVNLYT